MAKKRRRRGLHPAAVAMIVIVPVLLIPGGIAGAVYYFAVLPASGPPGRERMAGHWEADLPSGRILLNVQRDGKLDFTGITKSGIRDTQYRMYEVLKDRSRTITLHTTDPSGAYDPSDWKVEFLSDDRMRIEFPTSGATPVVYDRKK
jgi:hypothetical protein